MSNKFMKRIKKVARKNKVIYGIYKRYKHFTTDYYFISFPKTGRTWVRVMLGKYLTEKYGLDGVTKEEMLEVTPLHKKRKEIPKIIFTHDDDPQLKEVEDIQEKKEKYSDKEVMFLVRDPRDVVVSLYHQFDKRNEKIDETENKGINEFAKEKIENIIRFYNIWYQNRNIPKDFLLVKYEDLHEDTARELNRVINFIGEENINPDLVNSAVEFAKFEKMRKMEKNKEFETGKLAPGNKNDPNSYKTRKGKIGSYEEELNENTIKYINKMINEELSDNFDY